MNPTQKRFSLEPRGIKKQIPIRSKSKFLFVSYKSFLIGASFLRMLIVAAGFSQQARGDILLDAPSAGGSYYGMYCPSPCIAASFTLSASYNVSTIEVVLSTPTTTSFTTFDFSLQNSLTGPITTFASAALTAPQGGASTQVMNVNQTLVAGTYYLVGGVPGYFGTPVTPGDVDGWLLSGGIYNNAAGTITDGAWFLGGSTWSLTSGVNNGISYYAPEFSVNGSLAVPAAVPEPSTIALFMTGCLGLLGYRWVRQLRGQPGELGP